LQSPLLEEDAEVEVVLLAELLSVLEPLVEVIVSVVVPPLPLLTSSVVVVTPVGLTALETLASALGVALATEEDCLPWA
jgi:hypothetical protein